MKKCKMCGESKSLDNYYNAPRSGDGKQTYCKPCSTIRSVQSKIDNGEAWYHRDGFATEWEHFNHALERYAQIFDMPRLTRYKVTGSIKASDLKPKP